MRRLDGLPTMGRRVPTATDAAALRESSGLRRRLLDVGPKGKRLLVNQLAI
jgi:hypothetical protein